VLPWLVRGRSLALDTVAATAWAAGLAAATEWLAARAGDGAVEPRGLVVGAFAGALAAIALARAPEPRYWGHAEGS
jgi:hypothetical protein